MMLSLQTITFGIRCLIFSSYILNVYNMSVNILCEQYVSKAAAASVLCDVSFIKIS